MFSLQCTPDTITAYRVQLRIAAHLRRSLVRYIRHPMYFHATSSPKLWHPRCPLFEWCLVYVQKHMTPPPLLSSSHLLPFRISPLPPLVTIWDGMGWEGSGGRNTRRTPKCFVPEMQLISFHIESGTFPDSVPATIVF